MQIHRLGRIGAILQEKEKNKSSTDNENDELEDDFGRKSNVSLLDQHNELKKKAEGNFNLSTISKTVFIHLT